ncbi:MAG: Mur ligase family protein [Planctomycetota bacterium]|nr:Mur ligase family protein [Planctomycetota bacterium]
MHQLSSPHRRIRLKDLPTKIQGSGIDRFEFHSCSSDWKLCQPNDLYVAIDQAQGDGHDHVRQAIDQGAQAILAERIIPVDVPVFLTSDTREAFGHICHQLCDHPTRSLQSVGVTGTSGKSTVVEMLDTILNSAGKNPLRATRQDWLRVSGQKTLDPITSPQVSVALSDAVAMGKSHVILEMHSEELARRAWSGVQLDVAVLTALKADFRDLHGSFDNYLRASERLLDHLKDTGLVVIDADDPQLRKLLDKLPYPALTYGIKNEAEIMGEVLEESATDQLVMIHAGCDSIPVQLARPGQHFLSNALAATTSALAVGVELLEIQKGLEAYKPAAGILETIPQSRNSAQVYFDQAVFPDRLRATLSTLRKQASGKLWCLLEVSEKLTSRHRATMGSLLETHAHGAAISIAPNVAEVGFEAIHDVMDGYDNAGRDMVIPQLARAVDWVLAQAGRGDTILVAADASSYSETLAELSRSIAAPFSDENPEAPMTLRLDDYRNDH